MSTEKLAALINRLGGLVNARQGVEDELRAIVSELRMYSTRGLAVALLERALDRGCVTSRELGAAAARIQDEIKGRPERPVRPFLAGEGVCRSCLAPVAPGSAHRHFCTWTEEMGKAPATWCFWCQNGAPSSCDEVLEGMTCVQREAQS